MEASPVSDFLAVMAHSSRARVIDAKRREREGALLTRARQDPAPPRLKLHDSGFDLIAEIKRRSPSGGRRERVRHTRADVEKRTSAYVEGGATVISVLTEPTAFGGSLQDLARAAGCTSVPVLRKDFIVDPFQLIETRAAGAAGALVIVRLLTDEGLEEMLQAAGELGLFVLLEAFDRRDLDRIGAVVGLASSRGIQLLVGVNARDLSTLTVGRTRLRLFAEHGPTRVPRVAESGLRNENDIREAAKAGYCLALVGTALMEAARPAALVRRLVDAGRGETRKRCTSV